MNYQSAQHGKAGWPIDTVHADEGYVHITGKHKYPMSGEYATYALLGVWLFLSVWWFQLAPDFGQAFVWSLAGLCSLGLFIIPLEYLIRRNLDIKISRDAIDLYGSKFPRNVPIEFSVEPHSQTIKDPERRTYQGAIEVVMRYGENRVSVAEFRGKDKELAIALMLRLQNWSEHFDEAIAQEGQHPAPADLVAAGDFGPSPDIR